MTKNHKSHQIYAGFVGKWYRNVKKMITVLISQHLKLLRNKKSALKSKLYFAIWFHTGKTVFLRQGPVVCDK